MLSIIALALSIHSGTIKFFANQKHHKQYLISNYKYEKI
jgi:hypothetical protein